MLFEVLECTALLIFVWGKAFENGPIKICGRQPLKNLMEYGLLSRQNIEKWTKLNLRKTKADHTHSNFLKVVFHKFYLVHS